MDGIEVEAKRLSLIDVSFEDDCLIDLSHVQPAEEGNSVNMGDTVDQEGLVESVDFEKGRTGTDSFRDLEKTFQAVTQPFQSSPEMKGQNGKYNLRKSLAWDSAFFTSAGVLDPEELTSIIEGSEKKEKHGLPRIQEETSRSTESISTIESDGLTVASLEAELFEDIRASIQKSNKASSKENANSKTGAKLLEKKPRIASVKVDPGSHGKLKAKIGYKKPSLSTGKTTKQLSAVTQISQAKSVAAHKEPIQLPSRPPKLGANRCQPPKRDSVGANCTKPGKSKADNAVRGQSLSKAHVVVDGPRISIPRPKSSISDTAMKTEPATSRSSIDSSGSASSIGQGKSPLSCKKKSLDSSNRNSAGSDSSNRNVKAPPNGSQPRSSHLSSFLMSASQLSSSVSPSSSISEWSSESSSSISTVSQKSISCKISSIHGDSTQVRDLQKHSHDRQFCGNHTQGSTPPSRTKPLTKGVVPPNNMKPTGLRMPSPKMGYFDGMKLGRTPKGVRQRSQSIADAAFNEGGSTSISNSGSSNKGNPEKLIIATPDTKAVTTRISNRHLTSERRDSPQLPSKAKAIASGAHSNVKRSPGQSPSGKSQVKTEQVEAEGCGLSEQNVEKDGLQPAFQANETLDGIDIPLIPDFTPAKSAKKASSEDGVELLGQKKEESNDNAAGDYFFLSELVPAQLQSKDPITVPEALNCASKQSPSRVLNT